MVRDDEWHTEYSDLILAVKVVASQDEAIPHSGGWVRPGEAADVDRHTCSPVGGQFVRPGIGIAGEEGQVGSPVFDKLIIAQHADRFDLRDQGAGLHGAARV